MEKKMQRTQNKIFKGITAKDDILMRHPLLIYCSFGQRQTISEAAATMFGMWYRNTNSDISTSVCAVTLHHKGLCQVKMQPKHQTLVIS